jgi:murein L,D-transpeptidase YcbB/YkuD
LHGIDPDGVVSDATLAELNQSVTARIRQVELNLERWRWIPRALGDPYVLVNIPGFDLELYRNGTSAWHTRVVTGKVFTPTPLFSDRIVSIVVHPPWNVPESIAVNEYLPELRKNRDALERHGLKLLEGSGDKAREVNPRKVDWSQVSEDKFPYHLRQDPGAENPLGQLKFVLTNDFQVYLHDTPGGHAFNKTERDLSHGCVRVENALELASQIVSDAEKGEIFKALEEPDEKHIALASKIPVHIFYWTAWADEAGNLHFGPDVYGFDAPQRLALDRVAQIKAEARVTAGVSGSNL